MAYDDGEVRQQFSICFRARLLSADARTSSESKAVEWVSPSRLEDLQMHPSMRQRVADALRVDGPPHIG